MLTLAIVFSAPKYCDMTENKGAYINIGPDYKLDFKKFDAVPHPNIRPMVGVPADSVNLHCEPLLTHNTGLCQQLHHVVSDVSRRL